MSLISLKGVGELSDLGRDLESGHEDPLLSLEANILGPLHKPGKIRLVVDVSSDSEVLGVLGKEGCMRVSGFLGTFACGDHLLGALVQLLDLFED